MRRKPLRVALALAIALVAAVSASPAPAGSTGFVSASCAPDVFDGLAALSRTGTARGLGPTLRTEKDTTTYSGGTETGQKTPGKPTAGTIPVYVHVVHEVDGTGLVSAGDVDAQIAALNLTFSGFYGGDDTGFRFTLAGLDYTANDAWYAQETFADEVAMKSALKEGGPADLN